MTDAQTHKTVTLLIPVFNEGPGLDNLRDALLPLINNELTERPYNWQVLMVNDGSRDDSVERLRRMHAGDQRFQYISLSRNFGKENALLAGMDYAAGQCTVIMDADLQHPVEAIPEMLKRWEEGYDDVYGQRVTRGREPWLRKRMSLAYYALLRRLSPRVDILPNVGDFRLLDRRVVSAIASMRESQRYTKGLYCWVGFSKIAVPFEQKGRQTGQSSFSFLSLVNLAIEGITSYTTAPLRIASVAGVTVAALALLYMVYVVFKTIFFGEAIQGFPTLICVMLFLGGAQLLAIGIIGEYIARIFNESKGRPAYIVAEKNGEKV